MSPHSKFALALGLNALRLFFVGTPLLVAAEMVFKEKGLTPILIEWQLNIFNAFYENYSFAISLSITSAGGYLLSLFLHHIYKNAGWNWLPFLPLPFGNIGDNGLKLDLETPYITFASRIFHFLVLARVWIFPLRAWQWYVIFGCSLFSFFGFYSFFENFLSGPKTSIKVSELENGVNPKSRLLVARGYTPQFGNVSWGEKGKTDYFCMCVVSNEWTTNLPVALVMASNKENDLSQLNNLVSVEGLVKWRGVPAIAHVLFKKKGITIAPNARFLIIGKSFEDRFSMASILLYVIPVGLITLSINPFIKGSLLLWVWITSKAFFKSGTNDAGNTKILPWKVGDRCFAAWPSDGLYYSGYIKDRKSQEFFILFDDNQTAWVPKNKIVEIFIYEGLQVSCRWRGETAYYSCTVKKYIDDKILVLYDSGETEWTTIALIRTQI